MPLRVQQKDLSGLTAIVTGANIGVGLETARMLCEMKANVTIACRNAKKAENAAADIEKTTGNKPEIALLDLSTLASTASFVEEYKAKHERLDILINNAGVITTVNGAEAMSPDGFELTFQINHLSQFLMTIGLLPLLRKAAESKVNGFIPRVVTVSSKSARDGKIDYSYLQDSDKLPFWYSRYSDSKLMATMFIRKLSSVIKDDGVVAHVLHPGLVATDIFDKPYYNLPKIFVVLIGGFVNVFARNTVQGAMTSVHVAISDEAAQTTGKYWDSCKIAPDINKLMANDNAVNELWSKSEQYLKEKGYVLDI